MKTYNEMFENFKTGKITEDEWKAFCFQVLGEILEANKEIFIRLKFR